MDALQVTLSLVALVAGATALGLVWRATTGRARAGRGSVEGAALGLDEAAEVTLVQFSSEVCAPCRATARVLGQVADDRVRHLEIDVAERPDLASRFNVLQTPTTLIVDRGGAVRARIGGAVRRSVIDAELERILAA